MRFVCSFNLHGKCNCVLWERNKGNQRSRLILRSCTPNADIQLKADQKHKRIEIDRKHHDNKRTNRPVKRIVFAEIINVIGESD